MEFNHPGFTIKEKWEPKGNGCATSDDVLWKLDALQTFIHELQWPEEVFAEHLEHRLKLMATDMIEAMGNRLVLIGALQRKVSLNWCQDLLGEL